MKKIKAAIFGTGFMGRVHAEAARRLANVDIVAIAASSAEKARVFAEANAIPRATHNYKEILDDPEIEAVHLCTPNALHFPMAMDALRAGKHVLCEKPLANSVDDGLQMLALARQSGLRHCTAHNIRFYPQVQNMRAIVEAGELGQIWVVQGSYLQDWLLHESDWNWRIEGGPSRTFADIGTHWCDLAEFTTGLRISAVCSSLHTFLPVRKKPTQQTETFVTSQGEHRDFQVRTEDFGAMLFRLGDDAHGAMTTSQVSAGRKNRLSIEIYGSKSSAAWDAERPDELWLGYRDQPNQIVIKDPPLLRGKAASYADLPGGHSEGYDDTFKQLLRRFYQSVQNKGAAIEYPTFEDGIRQLTILDAVCESSKRQHWVSLKK